MPKAIQSMNKLVNGDKVFAMLLSLGTPMNIAAFELQDKKNVANVFPLSSAREMTEPFSPLHYSGLSTYYEQIRTGVTYLAEREGVSNVCAMYLPTDFGKDIEEAAKSISAETEGLNFVSETTHRPDDADFVGALQKLNADGCEIVALALGVRQAITVSGTAKTLGLSNMIFLNSAAGFHTVVAKVPGGVTEGLYAASGWADLLSRMDKPEVQKFFKRYTEATGEKLPGTGALLGHAGAVTMVRALENAGPDLDAGSFQKAMESLNYEDVVAGNFVSYSATDPRCRRGRDLCRQRRQLGRNQTILGPPPRRCHSFKKELVLSFARPFLCNHDPVARLSSLPAVKSPVGQADDRRQAAYLRVPETRSSMETPG